MKKVIYHDYTTHTFLTVPERFENYMESLGAELVKRGCDNRFKKIEDIWHVYMYMDTAILYQNLGISGSPAEKTVITLHGKPDSISKVEEIILKEMESQKDI